jgi:deazaflavin-dependent oxidoreductase (nitroreductase family)
MRLNGIFDLILRSRFHWLVSRGLTLITVTGRRSGRQYTIPVGYLETADAVVVLVGDAPSKTWWRNYMDAGPIEIRLRGVPRSGRAVVVPPDSEQFRCTAEESFRRSPIIPRLFGIAFDRRRGLTAEDAVRLAARAAIVRITLDADDGG